MEWAARPGRALRRLLSGAATRDESEEETDVYLESMGGRRVEAVYAMSGPARKKKGKAEIPEAKM